MRINDFLGLPRDTINLELTKVVVVVINECLITQHLQEFY